MIEEHSPHLHSMPDLPEPSKRRRTPSQYATQIDHFKNNVASKRPKNLKPCAFPPPSRIHSLPLCKLPNGTTFHLRIVLNPPPPKSVQRTAKKSSRGGEGTQVGGEVRMTEANLCLLDKLLSAVQNLQREQNDSKQNQNRPPKENPETKQEKRVDPFGGERLKEKDEKWRKNYERYASLSSCLHSLQHQLKFLL